jgi:hypothetical protein
MVCQCSSASTSFMLAALRVLHVDPFPRTGRNRLDPGTTFLDPSTTARGHNEVSSTNPQSNRTKKTRRRLRVE